MGTRRLALFLLAATLGAGVVVLPSVASSETAPTIEAAGSGGPYGFNWKPMEATVGSGASVTISNRAEVNHGVEWKSPPATPSCSGVPGASAAQPSFATKWSGTCTFSQPGSYTFWCTVHGQSMAGTVIVNANGTTTVTTATSTATSSSSASNPPGATSAPPYGAQPPGAPAAATPAPLAGSAAAAVRVPSSQRGNSVRGSLELSAAAVGGRLEVVLLAKAAAFASAGHSSQARAGRLVRTGLRAGRLTFAVPLNSRARSALRRHARLALSARIAISAPGATALLITRAVVIHA